MGEPEVVKSKTTPPAHEDEQGREDQANPGQIKNLCKKNLAKTAKRLLYFPNIHPVGAG
jgi:hypothetical protein